MSGITTHVLDTSRGRPAANVAVTLERQGDGAGDWIAVGRGSTDVDGRLKDLIDADAEVEAGTYRLTFETGAHFAAHGIESFYPRVVVIFSVSAGERYHVPLLVNPFGYSTYRGS